MTFHCCSLLCVAWFLILDISGKEFFDFRESRLANTRQWAYCERDNCHQSLRACLAYQWITCLFHSGRPWPRTAKQITVAYLKFLLIFVFHSVFVFFTKNIQQALLILGYMKFFSMKIAETLYLFFMNFHETTLPDSVISCNLRWFSSSFYLFQIFKMQFVIAALSFLQSVCGS